MPGRDPSAGTLTSAAAQVLSQRQFILQEREWGGSFLAYVPTRGLPFVRFQVFLMPTYDRGNSVFDARNYIRWRGVGALSPFQTPEVLGLTTRGSGSGNISEATVLTPPLLMPVGTPASFEVNAGGFSAVAVEFDTTFDTPAGTQGLDSVFVSISASS